MLPLILQDDHRSQNPLFKQSSFFIGMLIKKKLLAAFFKTFFRDCCLNTFSVCLSLKKTPHIFLIKKAYYIPKRKQLLTVIYTIQKGILRHLSFLHQSFQITISCEVGVAGFVSPRRLLRRWIGEKVRRRQQHKRKVTLKQDALIKKFNKK